MFLVLTFFIPLQELVDEEIWSLEELFSGGEAPVFSNFCKGAEELRFSHATVGGMEWG